MERPFSVARSPDSIIERAPTGSTLARFFHEYVLAGFDGITQMLRSEARRSCEDYQVDVAIDDFLVYPSNPL